MSILQNERGAALITALVILVLLTIIGMAATNTSTLETLIAGTEKNHTEAFYAAEAGIEHLRRNLQSVYLEKNANNLATIGKANWNFALEGQYEITNGDLGGNYRYNVTIWDNNDGDNDALKDADGVIYLRADAQVPGGGSASIEIMLYGFLDGSSAINDNNAQAGGGGGKNSSNNDVGAVDNFNRQLQ